MMIVIRKHEVIIDGEKKLIVIIRDYSDSIKFEKILLKQKEEDCRMNLIQNELNNAFE
jgi:hypothetical protein